MNWKKLKGWLEGGLGINTEPKPQQEILKK